MRFIRGCLIAAGCVLVFLGSAQAITIGETPVLRPPTTGTAIFCWPKPPISLRLQPSRACPSTSPAPAEI